MTLEPSMQLLTLFALVFVVVRALVRKAKRNQLRGHDIVLVNDEWLYKDTMTPTVGNIRACGYCGENDTKDGHDGCLGELPNIMNACCGHGIVNEAYIQQYDGSCVNGVKALKMIKDIKDAN